MPVVDLSGKWQGKMPADPEKRYSNIVERHPDKVDAFLRLAPTGVKWSNSFLKNPALQHHWIHLILYGAADVNRAQEAPTSLRDYVCKFFGLAKFEDCLTPARLAHLQTLKAANKATKNAAKPFGGTAAEVRRVQGALKRMSAAGAKITGSLKVEAGTEKRTIAANGDLL